MARNHEVRVKFSKEELAFIGINNPLIKGILDKKYEDIIAELLLEKESIRSEVLKLWAKETKDLIFALENIGKIKPKKENPPHTGI